jgi:hypothetical protein
MLIDGVYKRLKEGSIKGVVLFGDSLRVPPPPYVCLKPEPGTLHDRQNFRIIVHRNPGEQRLLETYLFEELDALFNHRVWLEQADGGKFRVLSTGDWYGPYAEDSDKSIVMERMFYAPKRL